jgi:hypothetical protein
MMKKCVKLSIFLMILGFLSFGESENGTKKNIPLLASTFLGGSDADDTYEPSIALDKDGNVYVTGFTSSHDFPTTPGAYSKNFSGGTRDRFVSKFNNDLTELLASTFLGGRGERGGIIGGNGDELGHAISVDDDGNVYLAGYTESTDFPVTKGSFDESYNGGRDVFISKLDSNLSTLLASTYIGGSGDEGFQWPRIDMTIDQNGDVYVAGITHSTDFPTSDFAFDRTFNGGLRAGDAFLVKLDGNLTNLLAATYIGGSGNEWRISVIMDENKSVIISGETESPDFPTTPEAYDKEANENDNIIKDIFISKLSLDLSTLKASTYFGGNNLEEALKIRVNKDGDIYAAGYTESKDFPTTQGAYNREWSGGQRDAFVAKFNNSLSRLIASTLFGGSIRDMARGIVLGKHGDIYVTGVTASPNFPDTSGTYKVNFRKGSLNQRDAVVSKFSADLNKLLVSFTFGGSSVDDAYCIEIDKNGDIYIAGLTTSHDFPTTEKAFDNSYNNGGNDCFIIKFDKNLSEKNN